MSITSLVTVAVLQCAPASLVGVVDGDTFDARAHFLNIHVDMRVRILGIDAPELRGGTSETKVMANKAKAWLWNRLAGVPFTVCTSGTDSFGRWLATVMVGDMPIGPDMIEAGLAREYEGK